MKELKIRGLVGSIISLCMGVAGIVFLLLPMLVEDTGHTIYSVFYSMINISEVSVILEQGVLYVASSALMIVFAILSLAMIALSITSLVGVCKKRYNLSMAIALRCISLIAAVVATVATILLLLYFSQNNLEKTTFGAGPIVSIAVALLGVGAAFVMPSARLLNSKLKKDDAPAKEVA